MRNHSRIVLFLDGQALDVTSTTTVGSDLFVVHVTGLVDGSLHCCTNAALRQVDELVPQRDVLGGLELACDTLDDRNTQKEPR